MSPAFWHSMERLSERFLLDKFEAGFFGIFNSKSRKEGQHRCMACQETGLVEQKPVDADAMEPFIPKLRPTVLPSRRLL